MSVELLTEHHLEFLSLKVDCTGSSESKCHIVGNHMSQLKLSSKEKHEQTKIVLGQPARGTVWSGTICLLSPASHLLETKDRFVQTINWKIHRFR